MALLFGALAAQRGGDVDGAGVPANDLSFAMLLRRQYGTGTPLAAAKSVRGYLMLRLLPQDKAALTAGILN